MCQANTEDIRKVDSGIDELRCLGGGRKVVSGYHSRNRAGPQTHLKNQGLFVENSEDVFMWVSLVLKDIGRTIRKYINFI